MKHLDRCQQVVLPLVTLLLTLILATPAYAHGVVITYTLKANGEVELLAEFDTGEPMGEAQVTIYAPDDPLTPWLTAVADAEGHYTFVIDPEIPGIWDIQFRKAGHGDIIHLQLEPGLIDPTLMDHAPGALLPDTPATAPAAEAKAETSASPVGQQSKIAEPVAEAAMEAAAVNIEETANETEAAATTANIVEPAMEATEITVTATEQVRVPAAAEIATEPEAIALVENRAEVDIAGSEPVAPGPPPSLAAREAATEVAVLSSGGNIAAGGGFSSFQILLMSASVIWGFVGTALYFSSKKRQEQPNSHEHGHHH